MTWTTYLCCLCVLVVNKDIEVTVFCAVKALSTDELRCFSKDQFGCFLSLIKKFVCSKSASWDKSWSRPRRRLPILLCSFLPTYVIAVNFNLNLCNSYFSPLLLCVTSLRIFLCINLTHYIDSKSEFCLWNKRKCRKLFYYLFFTFTTLFWCSGFSFSE